MAEITSHEQLMKSRDLSLAAAKAYAKCPDVPGLRTRADTAIEAFDRAAMKEVTAQAKEGVRYLQDEVIEPATEAIQAEHTAFICADYDAYQGRFATVNNNSRLFRDTAKEKLAILTDIQGDIARTIKKAEEAYAAGKAAEGAVDELEAALKKAGENLRAQHDRLKPLHEQALAAAKSRDAAALNKLRPAVLNAFQSLEKTWRDGEAMQREFAARHLKAAPLTAGKRRAMQEQFDAAVKPWQSNEVLIDSAARWARDVREQEVATVDPKKAAAVLGLDAKNAPAVAEALRGDESTVRKKLEALGRKLEHRLSGKDMFDRLRKAKMA